MKKLLWIVLTALLVCPLLSAASQDITVILDGRTLSFDVAPEITNDRTMVPMRQIFEQMGATVNWDEELKSIEVFSEETMMVLFIGKSDAIVNDRVVYLDSPPYIKDDRTLIPLRFVAENSGAKVDWEASTQTVTITSANMKSGFVPFGEYFSIPSPAGFTACAPVVYEKKGSVSVYAYPVADAGYDALLRYEAFLVQYGFSKTVDFKNDTSYFYNGKMVLKTYMKSDAGAELYYIELYADPTGATVPLS